MEWSFLGFTEAVQVREREDAGKEVKRHWTGRAWTLGGWPHDYARGPVCGDFSRIVAVSRSSRQDLFRRVGFKS